MAKYVDVEKVFCADCEDRDRCGSPDVFCDVHSMPAADVVPVVRGEWIYHECVSSCDGAISGYSCSQCCAFVDEEVFDMDEFHKDFCGNCGADMREVDDAEN